MSRARLVAGVALVCAAAVGGWWIFGRRSALGLPDAREAHLSVHWQGKFRGAMTVPARINWCPGSRRGILEAVSGDSGVAIVLYENDSLTSGPHVVGSPDLGSAMPVPGATVVLRWMRIDRDTAVTGFRSQGGTVRVALVRGKASGEINVRMQSASGFDTLAVQGSFRDVPVATTAAGCS